MEMYSEHKSGHSLLHKEGVRRVFFLFPLLLLILSWLPTSCEKSTAIDPEEEARRDSAALHVALMPVQDCLPFYLAAQTGIYERLGLDVRFHTLQAQLDTDTALVRNHVHLAYSDLARAIMIQQADSFDLRAIASSPAVLQLITTQRSRVRNLNQLKERMVAVARHSITDYWSDRLTDSAHMEQTDIFRPQINNLRIRTDMLCNGTMDAVFLPEPFASEALLRGNKRNFSTEGLLPQLGAFLVPTWVLHDSTRTEQLRLLFEGYHEAATLSKDNNGVRDSVSVLLRTLCHISDTLTDTIACQLPAFSMLRSPSKEDADVALRWLNTRGKARRGYTTDTLISVFNGLESLQ